MMLLEFDLTGFLGRFHPVVVHLPIGILFLVIALEFLRDKLNITSGTISWILIAGAMTAAISAALGWLLAEGGGYGGDTLFWHRWLGISVAVIALLAWWINVYGKFSSVWVYKGMLIALAVIIAITGHLGGTLTHGPTYLLEYAPAGLSRLLGGGAQQEVQLASDPDSVLVFDHLIKPILDSRCVECHNADKKKGDLNLESVEAMLEGGDGGEVIQPGLALESELFKRITLPVDHKKFMPADGNAPLNYHQIQLIGWWLDAGADLESSVLQTGVPEEIRFVLAQNYGLDSDPKPYVERAFVPPANTEILEKLQTAGFFAQPLASNNNFIEIKKKKTAPVEKQSLALLSSVAEQVAWLTLSEADLQDEDLSVLSELENLTMLRLDNNPISDAGIKSIAGLAHLESLNLYATGITGESLEVFQSLPSLKKLFLWQTAITPEQVTGIEEALPEVDIDFGWELESQLTSVEASP